MKRLYWFGIPAVVLAACGGSGSTPSLPPAGPEPASIDSSTAPLIAGGVASVVVGSGVLDNLGEGPVPLPVPTSAGAVAAQSDPDAHPVGRQAMGSIVPVGPETENCQVSGSVTVSGDLADPNTISAGDWIRFEFDGCDDGTGALLDGIFQLDFVSISGFETGLVDLVMDVTLDGFHATENGETSSGHGTVRLAVDTTMPPLSSLAMSTAELATTAGAVSHTLRAYNRTVTIDEGVFPVAATLEAEGALESSEFEGEVTFETVVPFQASGESYPFTGELLITGANDASIRLIALDEVNVRLEIDVDGDAAVDVTLDTAWAEIAG